MQIHTWLNYSDVEAPDYLFVNNNIINDENKNIEKSCCHANE